MYINLYKCQKYNLLGLGGRSLKISKIKIGIIIILIALFITNPTKVEFKDYITSKIENSNTDKNVENYNFLSSAFEGFALKLYTDAIEESTERKNYYLFSIYTVKFSKDEEGIVLGIFDKFIEVN